MRRMPSITIEGPSSEVEAFWTQFYSRPVGFGFLNTFYPEPQHTANDPAVYPWRARYWGTTVDIVVQYRTDSVGRDQTIAGGLNGADSNAHRALGRIAGLFPGCQIRYGDRLLGPIAGLLRKPITPPSILETRWHVCGYCEAKLARHANKQCMFAATHFTPRTTAWRTVYGVYLWQPHSSSFVLTAGNMTTAITTKPTVPGWNRAKPTGASRKRKPTA